MITRKPADRLTMAEVIQQLKILNGENVTVQLSLDETKSNSMDEPDD